MNKNIRNKLIWAIVFFAIGIFNLFTAPTLSYDLTEALCFYGGIFAMLIGAACLGSVIFYRSEVK